MKLSFVCPCYNEERNIEPFVNSIMQVFPITEEYEIILVNDGSRDNTFAEMLRVKQGVKANIKIVNLSRNFGKEAAMYAGLEQACGELVSIIDTDLQQDPNVVKQMVEILGQKADVDCVCACQIDRSENGFVAACKNGFYSLADKFTDVEFKSGASDFRTFRKSVKDAILSVSERNRFSKGIFSWVGFNTEYITYTANERVNGQSSFGFIKLFKYAMNGIMAFSTAPIKFASIIGSGAIVFSLIYAIITVIRKLVSDIQVDGFTQLIILIAFLGGIQLFSIGIIGEYIAKNYIESKGRPIYIAKDIIDYK